MKEYRYKHEVFFTEQSFIGTVKCKKDMYLLDVADFGDYILSEAYQTENSNNLDSYVITQKDGGDTFLLDPFARDLEEVKRRIHHSCKHRGLKENDLFKSMFISVQEKYGKW
jgi:hypothetical protein